MKVYQYLLFRIYMFYKDTIKEKANFSLSASLVTTVLISINLMTIYFLLDYLDIIVQILNKFYVVIFMTLVWMINYYGIVRKEKFLTYSFQKDKRGGFMVVGVIILTAFLAILVCNLNREKIFKGRNSHKQTSIE